MMDTRFRKIWKDLITRKARVLLTLIGLVIGLWGISTIIIGYSILSSDLSDNFLNTKPPDIIMNLENTGPIHSESLTSLPGVRHIENRPRLFCRLEIGQDYWFPLILFVVDDFRNLQVASFTPEGGSFPPPDGTLLIERDGNVLMKFFRPRKSNPGGHRAVQQPPLPKTDSSSFRIQLPGGIKLQTKISGTVFDPGLAPSRMELAIYGYVTRETAMKWMPNGFPDRLLIQVSPNMQGLTERKNLSDQIQANLGGMNVEGTSFPPPGEHPHQFQMNSILFLLFALGLLALLMSAVLVMNLVSSMLTNQIRQIGSLKAIGATSAQVAAIYLSSMFLLGFLASCVALPLAMKSGFRLSAIMAAMLNFEILTRELPWTLYAAMVFVGSLFPVVAAFPAVRRWSGVSVRDAMENYGVGTGAMRGSGIDKVQLPLPLFLRLAVRNSLRAPKRFVLTTLTVLIGALVFMITMNVRSSLLQTAAVEEAAKLHDISVTFEKEVEWDQISWMTRFPIVTNVELWQVSAAKPIDIGIVEKSAYPVIAVPGATRAIAPNIIEGRWISESQPDGIVVNHRFLSKHSGLKLGDRFTMEIDGRLTEVEICGVMKEFGGEALYMPASRLQAITGKGGSTGRIALVTLKPGTDEREFVSLLEQHFDLIGLTASRIQTSKIASKIIRNHLDMIIWMLGVLAFLMLIVSGFGMASGIGTSIVERTRELGVLRAIGATPAAIRRILSAESIFMACIAWLIAWIVAGPASRYLGAYFGTAIVEYPFDYRFNYAGVGLSLLVVVFLALVATFGPARMVSRQPVHEAVGYE